jgi:hypothetical protein
MNEERFRCGKGFRIIAAVIMGIFAATALSLITGVFVMLLWNWLMPSVFGLGTITFWQAFGLSLLAKLLLCGFGRMFPGPGHKPDRRWRENSRRWSRYKNWRFDDAYEQWWEKDGSESFENYMKKQKETEEEKQDKE